MLDDGVKVFTVALPFLETFLRVGLELFFIVLQIGLDLLCLLELLTDF
jgi:hypothetical protein